jgi:hypothetical protein
VAVDSGGIEAVVKLLYLENDKEQDGGSRNVWLRFLLLMIINPWILAREILSVSKF